MKHIETSLTGLAVIICGVILFLHGKTDDSIVAAGAMVAAGLGLVRAADGSQVKGGKDATDDKG